MPFKKVSNIAGWIVFGIAFIVYFFSVERTGSLWDCGEFILGAYKLQVVHPPGAPLFLLIGRMFSWLGDIFSDNPANIAFAVNLMSGMLTAFMAAFVSWITAILTKITFVGREEEPSQEQSYVAGGAGIVAGLSAAFASSIWFSAVEGEVYAMSTFFTAAVFWVIIKWYNLPDEPKNDRYLVLAVYLAGLSIGVHLLSLLTFPAIALFYYFKKYENHTYLKMAIAAGIGAAMIGITQKVIITGLPWMWAQFELLTVNSFGLPFHSGLVVVVLLLAGVIVFGLRYAHRKNNGLLQQMIMGFVMLVMAYTAYGMVILRAQARPPINMSAPTDAMRVLPYLNREQYGERPLLKGPNYEAKPIGLNTKEKYGRVGDHYEVVDQKISYKYRDSDKMLFPRISHTDQNRPSLYKMWNKSKSKKPTMAFNLSFFFRYQLGWMYWRYFMWNFVGRQNGDQGYFPWNHKDGNWYSGVSFIDEARLYNEDKLPKAMAKNQARNRYYFLPLIFGLLGLFYHLKHRRKDFIGLMALFLMTGIGIIIYSNQPPNEPRERDYVLAGSIFTFAIWIGMGVAALYEILKKRAKLPGLSTVIVSVALALTAPVIMGFQNFDDNGRRLHTGARDYANNFLQSCQKNAIIFTYGDNDTYPLWYAQEVEGIRTDVRVVNLSLIAVDWYIDNMRRKINESPNIKMSIPSESYRGSKRNTILFPDGIGQDREMPLSSVLKFIGEKHPINGGSGTTYESYLPTRKFYIPVDINKARKAGMLLPGDTSVVDRIRIDLGNRRYITKDELAILDVINSNIWDRPIYFSVTCQEKKLLGFKDYTQLEGLGLRIVPVKSKSDKNFYIYGSGRVNADQAYDNIINKFKWGNFDKYEMFVDRSYGAAIQAHRMVMLRTAMVLLNEGKTQKATDLANKYFEAFPNMNFTYTAQIVPFLNIYVNTNAIEPLKKHLEILARESADHMEFYLSLSDADLEAGFQQNAGMTMQAIRDCQRLLQYINDDAYKKKINDMIDPYLQTNLLK